MKQHRLFRIVQLAVLTQMCQKLFCQDRLYPEKVLRILLLKLSVNIHKDQVTHMNIIRLQPGDPPPERTVFQFNKLRFLPGRRKLTEKHGSDLIGQLSRVDRPLERFILKVSGMMPGNDPKRNINDHHRAVKKLKDIPCKDLKTARMQKIIQK